MSFSTALIALLQTKAGTVGTIAAATTVAGLGVASNVVDDATTDALEQAEVASEDGEEVELPDLADLDEVDTHQVEVESNGEGPSDVAIAVWKALTGPEGDSDGLDPRTAENGEFGGAVAENAREGGADFGLGVAGAAKEAAEAQGGGEVETEDDGNGGRPDGVGPPEDLPAPASP